MSALPPKADIDGNKLWMSDQNLWVYAISAIRLPPAAFGVIGGFGT
jgi:hypothetical protein